MFQPKKYPLQRLQEVLLAGLLSFSFSEFSYSASVAAAIGL
jgi:hypothetical protein